MSVIAADKTGTLTENRMTLARLWPSPAAHGAGPAGAGHDILAWPSPRPATTPP